MQLKGPPDAVKRILSILLFSSPFRHWKMALCSESTGSILEPYFFAASMTSLPAVTNVSLFAKAISVEFLIASIVGTRPIIPTAVTSVSIDFEDAILISPSRPW